MSPKGRKVKPGNCVNLLHKRHGYAIIQSLMKNKKNTAKAKTVKGIAPLTQKTLIIAFAAAYLLQLATTVYSFIQFKLADVSFMFYNAYIVSNFVVPIVVLGGAYVISRPTLTKTGRLFQATLITVAALTVQILLQSINYAVFQNQLGYVNAPADMYAPWIELIPSVITLVLAGIASWYLRDVTKSKKEDVSPRTQAAFVIISALSLIGQPVVALLSASSGTTSPNSDVMGMLLVMVIPAIVFAIIYFITSSVRPQIQRIFLTAIYIVIGMCIIMFTTTLVGVIYWGNSHGMSIPINMVIPEIVALLVFAGIIAWHKRLHLL